MKSMLLFHPHDTEFSSEVTKNTSFQESFQIYSMCTYISLHKIITCFTLYSPCVHFMIYFQMCSIFVKIELHSQFLYWLHSIPVYVHAKFILPDYMDEYLSSFQYFVI